MSRIHPTSMVDPAARIGERVTIGPCTEVRAGAVVGDDSVIEGFCIIGYETPLAEGALELGVGRTSGATASSTRGQASGRDSPPVIA